MTGDVPVDEVTEIVEGGSGIMSSDGSDAEGGSGTAFSSAVCVAIVVDVTTSGWVTVWRNVEEEDGSV